MATDSHPEPRSLPARPNLRHLRDQAKDLLRAGGAASLSEAQLKIAREYGFPSWPKLKARVDSLTEIGRLKDAIDAEDLDRVKAMLTLNPALHRAPIGYGNNGPLTWVAECRGVKGPPSPARLEMARWMIENGSDVHQGGDGPLMRASLDARLSMLELLVKHGADVNARWSGHYPIVLGPCECLAPESLRWLLEHGADPKNSSPDYGDPLSIILCAYARNAAHKHACLEILAGAGCELPDTPALALHRGRTDLLEAHLRQDPDLLARRFGEAEVYPPELGIKPGDGLTATPVAGGTLLHLAIEFDDLETAAWLVERGADVNARAAVDGEGFGGHTPLYHAVVTLGRRDDAKARFLLRHGADPNVRTTLRKQLRSMGDPEKERPHTFRDVTPIGYARGFLEPHWVSELALTAIAERGGTAG